jgi:NADPH:quinone reductase-like Zn-dependent oxidoreductase
MKAIYLVKNGPANKAFEIRDVDLPEIEPHEVLIKVEAFGLNYADVMARLGLYPECPPLPTVIGYEVVGRIHQTGSAVHNVKKGDRVLGLTLFGGYAEYAKSDSRGIIKIPEDWDAAKSTAYGVQYSTAWYSACVLLNLFPNDRVLIHAAAGGVGTALVQIAKHKGCIVFGTAGSDEKMEYLKSLGVDFPINYKKSDFENEIRKLNENNRIDVVFDPVGGKSIKKGLRLLGSGGRIVCFGASSMTGKNNIFTKLPVFLQFGFYHPAQLMMRSKSIMGVNMLKLGQNKPEIMKRVFRELIDEVNKGYLNPPKINTFSFDQISEAHEFMESRKSIGKIAITT